MAIRDAKKAAEASILSGFRHHDPEKETLLIECYLTGSTGGTEEELQAHREQIDSYFDVMAPNRLRAMKNGVIVIVALVCRAAIRLGLDSEESYSISDYYLYTVERCQSEDELEQLSLQALRHYASLVQALETRAYSQPVAKAIRYIKAHLYERCTVEAVAVYAGLNAQYFSGLFKRETGLPPSRYIREKKLDEAVKLLRQRGYPIWEVAEMLGFSSASHFEQVFKERFEVTAKQFAKMRKTSQK